MRRWESPADGLGARGRPAQGSPAVGRDGAVEPERSLSRFVAGGAPHVPPEQAARLACDLYGVAGVLRALPSERDQNFLVRDRAGRAFVLKIANAGERREVLEAQNAAMAHVARHDPSIGCQRVHTTKTGAALGEAEGPDGRRHFVRLLSYLPGTPLARTTPRTATLLRSVGRLLGRLDVALEGFWHPGVRRALPWDLTAAPELIGSHLDTIGDPEQRGVLTRLLTRVAATVAPQWGELPAGAIHNDGNDHNVLVGPDATASALLDFGDLIEGATVVEAAVGAAYALLDEADPLAAAVEVVRGYHETRALGPLECEVLHELVMLRLGLSVVIASVQRRLDPSNAYLTVSERPAWRALARLLALDPPTVRSAFRRACGMERPVTSPEMSREAILAVRHRHFGRGLRLHYEEPLRLVRGWMQYLYDDGGRAYLDAANNVCHVGHCHPAVVRAAERQMATLNTNTRYLYDRLAEYVERLTALFPEPLSVCYLVCSGSEANELALRLARAHTGRRDVIVVDHAYHGNTTTLADVSPYKYNGPGGAGAPPWVHQVELPDRYRGRHRDPGAAGAAYAADVERAVAQAAKRGGVAAFLCESLMGCGGQVVLPDGYLAHAYRTVRDAGGVCIADEVQVGFGRLGTRLWGFESQGVVPDIVTLGKPIGNGHPLGAVITTPAIAASFDTGMEYFNTFGGNPVSCAVGLAVLNVLEEEGLPEQARVVGARLLAGLERLARDRPAIGDVRGLGLFLGVDLVADRETRAPAPALAGVVVERMKAHGVLVGVEGPGHNVLKIKPPLVFSAANADLLVETLGDVLSVSDLGA